MSNTKNINVNVHRPPTNIPLGRQGENLATCVTFDCTGLAQLYGDGTAELLHELKDGTVYPVAIKQDGTSVSWTVSASDTANIGSGRAELRWYVGDTLAKSAKFRTSVSSALADTTTETPPAPQQSWVDKVLQAAQEIKDGAISDEKLAAAIAAYLADHPIDAGLDETALAAYLVENGYLTDEALADAIAKALADAKASGEFDGDPGVDGTDGGYYTPSVDDDGNLTWTASSEGMPAVAGVNIRGPQGEAGPAGADGKSAYQYAQDGGYTGTEAEFAAKLAKEMPDKLPNPNALTFSGAVTGTYDGSAPLSVEIPSGGGDETPIDTISEGTLSEDVANIVIDGFSKRAIALVTVPYGSTANSGTIKISLKFGLDSGDVLTCAPAFNFVTNTAVVAWNKIVVFAFVENGIIEVTIHRDSGTISKDIYMRFSTSTPNTWLAKSVYIDAKKITSVTIGLQADGVIGKNTVYKVVGR